MHTSFSTNPQSILVQTLLGVLLLAMSSQSLWAQLTPDRLYFGVGQRVVIQVDAPEDFLGDLTIKLLDPRTLIELHSAPAAKGRVDLTGLFPAIWAEKSTKVMLAQLYLDSVATGSPLVVQPMVTPNIATRADPTTMKISEDSTAIVVFEDDRLSTRFAKGEIQSPDRQEVIFSGLRVYVEQEVVFETTAGEIVFRLRPDAAPNTAYNFMHLAAGGFYTNIIFHRVVATTADGRPFVIQVGDPSGTGSGGPGYMIDLEKSNLPHDLGVLSMARSADPNTNGSQVFVCLSKAGTMPLDGRYTAFAQAVSGAEAIQKIASVAVDANDRPLDPPMIFKAIVRDAPSIADRSAPISTAEPATNEFIKQPAVSDR
jgi:cyclophilin family peptidyl-prolyl cis-trans isomerase